MKLQCVHHRGFTLIEVVMVIVITTTLAALAIPRYANALSNYRADAAANQIVSDLGYARARATSSSSSRTVNFSVASASYQILNETSLNHSGGSFLTNLSATPYNASIVSANFAGAATVSFNGYGAPSSSGSIVVRAGQTTRQINLSAGSGVASVQ